MTIQKHNTKHTTLKTQHEKHCTNNSTLKTKKTIYQTKTILNTQY